MPSKNNSPESQQPVAVIGGTGLDQLESLLVERRQIVSTPFGSPSAALTFGWLEDKPVVFLARHGDRHTVPPHKINYRANLWALKKSGAKRIIAIAAAGGIARDMTPGAIAFPDQIVDYTYGRAQTYFEEGLEHTVHVDFTYPYSEPLRNTLIAAARRQKLGAREYGVYGATQGPRLETASEIRRMERDGCQLVGMTGMPEAALARELEVEYATCAVIVNWAAGKSAGVITMDTIRQHLATGMEKVKRLLEAVVLDL